AGQLQAIHDRLLGTDAPDQCGDGCGCPLDGASELDVDTVRLLEEGSAAPEAPFSCSLDGDRMTGRIAEWRAVSSQAVERSQTAEGLRLGFRPEAALGARLAELAAAEVTCCSFFRIGLSFEAGSIWLDVRSPVEARGLIDELLGAGTG
ncbi:MAG: hypothetical protein ACYDAD_12705, partial [Acidimicrobiales bacterium]